MKIPTEPTVSVERLAELFEVDRNTVYDAVRSGEVPAVRLGRCIRIPTAWVRARLLLDVGRDGAQIVGHGFVLGGDIDA
jgi:excisionase family DNA binding protein